MPAIDGTGLRYQGQAAVGIAMHQLGRGHIRVFLQRIIRIFIKEYFPGIRKTLLFYGIVLIIPINKGKIIRGYSQRINSCSLL